MNSDPPAAYPVATWFGPEESPLFGLLNTPGTQVRGAVILCPSLGREHTSAYSTFAQLAARLAEVGLLAFRFDYRSTGDSFERAHADAGSVGLLDDVRYAVDFVRGLGATRVALVGMRIGALLAGLASALEPFEAVVMWDPCANGRSFVREQRMLSLRIPVAGRSDIETDDIPGFHLSLDILREVSLLELDETTATLAERVLLLSRLDHRADRTLVDRLVLPNVEHRNVLGQDELLYTPTPLQVVPEAALETIVAWVDDVMPPDSQPVSLPETGDVAVSFDMPGTGTAEGGKPPVAVVERAVRLAPFGLFGIVTEPKAGASGPICVFVSVANEHRIGPGRLWVELSRRLAESGLACVRLDLSGFGDSPARVAFPPPIYAFDAVEDVVAAARALSPEAPANVALFGLCSSAYHVLEAASILSPRGVCALNPAVSFPVPETERGDPVDPRRKFFLPEPSIAATTSKVTSVRWLEAQIPFLKWLGTRFPVTIMKMRRLAKITIERLGQPYRTVAWRSGTRPGRARSGPGEHLASLASTGSNVLLICGSEEIRPFRYAAERSKQSSNVRGQLRTEVIPALDHALRRPKDRDEVSDLILEFAREHFLT